MNLLINNIEQRRTPERVDTELVLYGRSVDAPEETVEVVVEGFRPYLYAAEKVVREIETYLLEQDSVTAIDYDVSYEPLTEDCEVAKIYTRNPADVPSVAEQLERTWNADVPYTNRFLIDRDIRAYASIPEVPDSTGEIRCDYREVSGTTPTLQAEETGLQNVEPRVCTLDIEVDDRADGFPEHGQERILSIVAHDNYTDETHAFIDLNNEPVEETLGSEAPDGVDAVHFQPNERQMLIDFRSWFTNTDPDIVTGWNCLPEDTQVQMADGSSVPIADVKVGDEIIGVEEQQPSIGKVTNKWQDTNEVLSLSLEDGSELRATEDHRIMVGDDEKVGWEEAGEIEQGDMVLKPREIPATERGSTWLSEREMYLAGLIMSDGSMERGQGITFYNTCEKLHAQFEKDNALTPDGTGCYSQNVLDTEYAAEFNRLGIPFGDKNENGADLSAVYQLPRSKIGAFLAGVLDGDGTLSGNTVTLAAKDETTRYWYQRLLRRLGIYATQHNDGVYVPKADREKERLQEWLGEWSVHPDKPFDRLDGGTSSMAETVPGAIVETGVGSDERRITNDKLRRGVNCKRHETTSNEWREWVFVPVESVEPDGEETTYDIETTVSSFIADDVLVHNCDDFDIPFIIERFAELNGLNENTLSRMSWAGVTSRGEPRIKGRTVYDLLDVYKANSFTELDSYRLDDVAKEEVGAQKIEFDGSYYELYENETRKFLEYNARDVELTVGINEAAGVIEFRDVLRREVGVMFEDSYNANDFIEMMCRRKLRERGEVGPTAEYHGKSDYEGAHVFDAYTGVAENVVGIDLASLYPYTMRMLNASPETYVEDESEEDVYVADNGAAFEAGDHGLFAELVEGAIGLKEEYKEKRDNAETDEEYEKWAQKYASAKTITNSIYGVTGWERFFLYHEKVAEAVTLTGQAVIKETANTVSERGYEVIYGDTDSTYIKLPDHWDREHCLDTAESLCDTLNEHIYPGMAEERGIPAEDNLWEIEVEAYMKRFFQAGKKKRYAYLATWKDGREVDDPKPSISGFSSKRSDSSALTEETEEKVLNAILHGNEEAVRDIVYEAAQEVEATPESWERIGIPSGMGKKITDDPELGERDEYYAVSDGVPQDAHPRAVYNSNELLNLGLGSADKPMRVYIEPLGSKTLGRTINVLAFETDADIEPVEDILRVDVQRMLDTILINPLKEILSAIDMNITAVIRGQEQSGLGAFTNES